MKIKRGALRCGIFEIGGDGERHVNRVEAIWGHRTVDLAENGRCDELVLLWVDDFEGTRS